MNCPRCSTGLMITETYFDGFESPSGKWTFHRCLICSHHMDPVMEMNRRYPELCKESRNHSTYAEAALAYHGGGAEK